MNKALETERLSEEAAKDFQTRYFVLVESVARALATVKFGDDAHWRAFWQTAMTSVPPPLVLSCLDLSQDERGGEVVAWRDVLAERKRQIEAEGWTPEHDDAHTDGSMAAAAACYALYASGLPEQHSRHYWPWAWKWWKPDAGNIRRMLVKAAALIIAEIERLDRSALTAASKKEPETNG